MKQKAACRIFSTRIPGFFLVLCDTIEWRELRTAIYFELVFHTGYVCNGLRPDPT
jgi:hypothetical protein